MNAPAHLDRSGRAHSGRTGTGRGGGRRPALRWVLAGTGLGLAALALAACGSSSSASTTSTPSRSSGAARGSGTGGSHAGQRQFPGASGTIAAIDGSTLEVQGTSSQTSVTYTSTTTFSQTVAGTAAEVTVGSCISAFGKPTSSGTAAKGATFDRPITATTVSISQPQSGTCARGFGGFGGFAGRGGASGSAGAGRTFSGGGRGPEGGLGSGGQARRPPAGGASRFGGQFGAASGTVTAVAGSKVTVSETNPRSKATTSVVVTLGPSATYTVQQSASAADLAVGHCATAVGTASDTGAITARSITLSTPGANGCTARFAGPGGAASGARPVPDRSAAAQTLDTDDVQPPTAPVPPTAPGPVSHRRPLGRAVTPLRLVAVGILVIAGLVAWSLTGGAAPAYRAATVTTGTVQSTIDGVGTVTPVDQADLGFQTAGTVAAVDVTVGQKVTAGQSLASLDTATLEATVASDQASLAKAEAKLASDESSQTSGTSSAPTSTGTGGTGNGAGEASGTRSGTGTGTSGSSGSQGAIGASSAQALAAVRKLQAQLVSDQQRLDRDSATVQAALGAATTACASGTGASPTTSTTSTASTPAPDCAGALAVASSDQQKVSADVQQVDQDERALTAAIASLTDAGTASTETGAAPTGTGTTPTGTGATARLTAEVTTTASDSATPGESGTSDDLSAESSGSGTGSRAVTSEQLAVDQADIDVAAAGLTGAQQSLADATLTSPIDGTVGSLGIAPGDSVGSGSTSAVVVVGAGNDYRVVTDVDVARLHLVAAGDPALVTPDATDVVLHGAVSSIGVAADSSSTGTTTYPVTITLTTTDLDGLSGAQAQVDIVDRTIAHVTTVPSSAVATVGSRHFVTVLDGSTATRTPVAIGTVGDVRTQVKSGVHAGERVSLADLNAAVPSTSADTFGSGFEGRTGFGGGRFSGEAGSVARAAGPGGGVGG